MNANHTPVPPPPLPAHHSALSRRELLMLACLTLCWGLNWPVMKIGVQSFPPLSFRALSMALGLPILWLAARYSKQSLAISGAQILPLLRLALPNTIIWHVAIILAVQRLASGRAAILGYTMPLWALLWAWLLYREKPGRRGALGLMFALSAVVLLLSNELTRLYGNPSGTLLALLAAVAWAYGTVALKRSTLALPTIAITFWMLLFADLVLSVGAFYFERAQWRALSQAEWGAVLYNAILIFGFAHLAWFYLARRLPPVAAGLSVMMIPVIGVFSANWMLHEQAVWQDYAGLVLMMAAMACTLLKKPA